MHITKREREILTLLTLSNQKIADRLGVSSNTIRRHVHNLLSKFGNAKTRINLLITALKTNVIRLDEIKENTCDDR